MSFKKIAQSLNAYVKSKDYKHIEEIEIFFQSLFEVEFAKFWQYDEKSESLSLLGETANEVQSLSRSVTQQALHSKKLVVVKHLTSDKYYSPQIDNPLEFKIKSLLVFPIMKGNKTLGVLKLWKGIKQRKIFSKQDEKELEKYMPLLVNIFELKEIDKNELRYLMGEIPSPIVQKAKTKKVLNASKSGSKDKKEHALQDETKGLKKKFDASLKENESLEKSLKVSQKKEEVSEKKILKLQDEMNDLSQKLKESEKIHKELEVAALEFSGMVSEYRETQEKLNDKINLLSSENKDLESKIKESENKSKQTSLQELKSQNALLNHRTPLEENIETILHNMANNLVDSEHSYMLFEFILYALNSKKGKSAIEESLGKSKLIQELIGEYYFKGGIKVYNEKHIISTFSKHILEYTQNIFSKDFVVNLKLAKDLPPSLVFDGPKLQSIVYHLLTDLYQFIDYSQPLDIYFKYTNKMFTIELRGSVHQKNSLFKSMFKKSILGGNEKDRLGLILSQKLIERLKGTIESVYDNSQYKFVISLPTQKIKM